MKGLDGCIQILILIFLSRSADIPGAVEQACFFKRAQQAAPLRVPIHADFQRRGAACCALLKAFSTAQFLSAFQPVSAIFYVLEKVAAFR
jgi:hypothetical protein